MSQPGPKYAFTTDDLSAYERIDPDQFPNHDNVDSTVAEAIIADDGPVDGEPDPHARPR